MKRFEEPKVEIQTLAVDDVITTSTEIDCVGYNPSCPNETGRT